MTTKQKKPYGDMPWLSRKRDCIRAARMTTQTKAEHAAELERLTAEYLAQGNQIKRGHDCPVDPVYSHYKAYGRGGYA